jgi:hypothetical protein
VKFRIPSPSLAVSAAAMFVALGGGGIAVAATNWNPTEQHVKQLIAHSTAGNANHLGGFGPSYFLKAKHLATSNGEQFLSAGQTAVLGKTGHFTFSSTCSKDSTGQNQATFDVTANTTADLDGTGVMPAGSKVNIHTNSDALDTTPGNPLNPGDFDQVGSASSSTEIAADGQEVDVFYNDGVNWPAVNGSPAHDCFAGYTGILG